MFKEKKNTIYTVKVSKEGVRTSSCKLDSAFPWLLFLVWFQLSLVLVPKLCKAFCLAADWNPFQTGSCSARVNFYSRFKVKSIRKLRVLTLRIKYTELLNHNCCPSQQPCHYSRPEWRCDTAFFSLCVPFSALQSPVPHLWLIVWTEPKNGNRELSLGVFLPCCPCTLGEKSFPVLWVCKLQQTYKTSKNVNWGD